ncbi:hypothetical protein [Caballeronia grimmiae]|uniref:hypothetical protein n=1 Tax=Caballeronia grimmiae TaxID=1071679 RepID=UPI0038B8EF5D
MMKLRELKECPGGTVSRLTIMAMTPCNFERRVIAKTSQSVLDAGPVPETIA